MRFIHIASFSGNVGDIINHEGFYSSVLKNVDIDKIEIRKFYRNSNELHFDRDILHLINSYDGLIIGGGGFFDVRWNDSETGTTFDMSNKFLEGIEIPVLVNAMGIHIEDLANKVAINKFISFLEKIIKNDKWMITLRNDGSYSRLKSIYNNQDATIKVVPDNGFAFPQVKYKGDSRIVGLSITNDLFNKDFNGNISTDEFNKQISELCRYILAQNNDIIFFLHAPQDIQVIYWIYNYLGNERFRRRIKIAPYDVYTIEGANLLNQLYSTCKYIVAMRFHGNVLAIKNYVPVIGLAGHEQILGLYQELGLTDQCVVVNENFWDEMISLINLMEANPHQYSDKERKVFENIVSEQKEYSCCVENFFNKSFRRTNQ